MLKRLELRDAQSCLSKADPDEVIFVLRAKDPLAAQTVRLWAAMAQGVHEPEKITAAVVCATQMEGWAKKNSPATPDHVVNGTGRAGGWVAAGEVGGAGGAGGAPYSVGGKGG